MKTIAGSTFNANVMLPAFDRSTLQSRIVHLGFGAFHRAHQALFTHHVLEKTAADWGICAVNLFGNTDLITSLRKQQHLYTVVEKGAGSTDIKVIGAIRESLHPNCDGINTILEKMAEPQVAIVSLTITEKGYCVDPVTGILDTDNPWVIHDLIHPTEPQSAIGYIVQALNLRRQRNLAPFTVLSCDNIQGNGRVAKAAVLEFARLLDPELSDWIEAHATFPCTMVDRIVPAVTEATLTEISELLGVEDPCGVACEPFRQWIIEDDFVAGRPDWDLAGAEFVSHVLPYEEMKLRMLNGSHSFLAYLGYLGGYAHISDTMTDEHYRRAAFEMMMNNQAPSLKMPAGTDLEGYAKLLIERFSNPCLQHKTWQIAMDGSQKIPQRLGGSLLYHLRQGSDFSWIAVGIAGWMRYVADIDEQGDPINVHDPMLPQLQNIYRRHGVNRSVVAALLAIDTIFPVEIGQNHRVVTAVTEAYQSLLDHGARATVATL